MKIARLSESNVTLQDNGMLARAMTIDNSKDGTTEGRDEASGA